MDVLTLQVFDALCLNRCGIAEFNDANRNAFEFRNFGRSETARVRVGKAVPNSFAFGATEVGIDAKTFEQEGIEVVATGFRGDAQLQQAMKQVS